MGVTKYFVLNGKKFTVTYALGTVQMDSRRDFVAPHHDPSIHFAPQNTQGERYIDQTNLGKSDTLRVEQSGLTVDCENEFLTPSSLRRDVSPVSKGAKHITITQEDGSKYEYHVSQIENENSHSSMSLLINNQMQAVTFDFTQPQSAPHIFVQGKKYEVQQEQRILGAQKDKTLSCKPASMISETHIKSPLAGRVVRVLSCAGAAVLAGQPLVVIESMKMENEICASRDGIIKTLFIALGNLVQPNQPLIELEMKGGRDADPENADGQATI